MSVAMSCSHTYTMSRQHSRSSRFPNKFKRLKIHRTRAKREMRRTLRKSESLCYIWTARYSNSRGALAHEPSMYCILILIKVTSVPGSAGMSATWRGKIVSLIVTSEPLIYSSSLTLTEIEHLLV